MTELEKRVASLEKEIAALKGQVSERQKDSLRTIKFLVVLTILQALQVFIAWYPKLKVILSSLTQ